MTPEKFEMMEPMKYYDNPEPTTPSAIQKRDDMISNKDFVDHFKNDHYEIEEGDKIVIGYMGQQKKASTSRNGNNRGGGMMGGAPGGAPSGAPGGRR